MDFDEVRRMALAHPGVEEGNSRGTIAFHVKRKRFARMRADADSLVPRCNIYERRHLVEEMPEIFICGTTTASVPACWSASPPSRGSCCGRRGRPRGGWRRRPGSPPGWTGIRRG